MWLVIVQVPYAIAAKSAWPDRVAIAFIGDGAMLMNGINEFITIAENWKNWKDPRLIIVVLANQDLNMVSWEQRIMNGDAKFEPSQNVPNFHFASYAEMLGLKGIRVDQPEQIGPAWDEALGSSCPVLIEAVTDPEVPPLPPHISVAQAMHFSEALLYDADRTRIWRCDERNDRDSFLA